MLIEFYGAECIHCMRMVPSIEKLEKETGLKIERYETWHNDENAKKLKDMDKENCGGVPFFINTDSKGTICGETTYAELKKWAGAELGSKFLPRKI